MKRRPFLTGALASLLAACGGRGGTVLTPSEIEARWPPLGQMVEAGPHRIHTWERGSGQPVILIHGASGNLRDWTFYLGPRIAARRRAIAFDRPGLGYSERGTASAHDPAAQARILQAAAQAIGAERPILVGHSWGAALAMAWALADPDGVAGVVVVSGAVMPWSERPLLAEVLGIEETLVGAYLGLVSSGEDGTERFVRRIFRPQEPPEGYVDYIGGELSLRADTLAANRADIAGLNAALRRQARDYGRVSVPVEVISGTADPIIRPDRQPIPFASRVPNARLTLLQGVGHMAHHAAPEAVLAALDRIDPASA